MENQLAIILKTHEMQSSSAEQNGYKKPTIKDTVQSFGYDLANDYGFLEMYIDSWGLKMSRAEDAFDNNWSHLFVGE